MSAYAGQKIAFLTQHGKEQIIASVPEPGLARVVERISGFDTDQLSTFTRDTSRPDSQLEAAWRKICIGMKLSGLSVGFYRKVCVDICFVSFAAATVR